MTRTLLERLFDMAEEHGKPYMNIYRLHSDYTHRLIERDGESIVDTQRKAADVIERWLGYECYKKEKEARKLYER